MGCQTEGGEEEFRKRFVYLTPFCFFFNWEPPTVFSVSKHLTQLNNLSRSFQIW
jgi:hypothetical protein